MMPITWQALVDFVAPIALGGVGAFVSFVSLLPTKLGERLISSHFDNKLQAIKHDQAKELGKLQAELDHFKDRGTRSNEREYQAVQQTWDRFVEAFELCKGAIAQYFSIPDLDQMNESDISSFLAANDVPEVSREYILKASDKKGAFGWYVRSKLINDAGTAYALVRDTLEKQSVFIPEDLFKKFDAALALLRQSWAEQKTAMGAEQRASSGRGYVPEQKASLELLGPAGQTMFDGLRDAVRARLLRAP